MQKFIQKVPVIVGPTAVGKTVLSILLARELNGQIISADSRQIYKYLDIGTAKVEAEYQQEIPHHFIDFLEPDTYYSAGMFAKDARKKIGELLNKNIVPIVVGGSGLYIRALIDGIFEVDAKDEKIRNDLDTEIAEKGLESLYLQLKQVDPEYASKISENDARRITRALEVFQITSKTFSDWHNEKTEPAPFETVQIGLNSERKILYDRINQRVEKMIAQGLVEEVKKLIKRGYTRDLNALNTVGYKEVFDFLENKIDASGMLELIQRNTRRYAKRQLTWFNADQRIHWFDVVHKDSLIDISKDILKLLS